MLTASHGLVWNCMIDQALMADPCLEFILTESVPSPCFVIDADRLRANGKIFAKLQGQTGVKILLALKGYAAFATFPLLSRSMGGPLWGVCASSVHEARLGREEFGGEVHAFAAAWTDAEMAELLTLIDHITFNSLAQWRHFRPMVEAANAGRQRPILCGLRVNPEHSEGAVAIYNPCSPSSRLGIRPREMSGITEDDWRGLTGLHFHTLCEQDAQALARTLAAFGEKFAPWIKRCQWLNLGGGHHITRPGYDLDLLKKLLITWRDRCGVQLYLEPGEAVALNAGWLLTTVLDLVQADLPVAILDTSAACHMPDVLEMPYRPHVRLINGSTMMEAGEAGALPFTCRLAGKSCLAGDEIGIYSFPKTLKPGDKLAFADMAIYSMVKTTTFNGLNLPSIAIYDGNAEQPLRLVRQFGYEDFKGRLS